MRRHFQKSLKLQNGVWVPEATDCALRFSVVEWVAFNIYMVQTKITISSVNMKERVALGLRAGDTVDFAVGFGNGF